jgi:hypothetical protein
VLAVGTTDGLVVLWQVQLAGKPATAIPAFINGYPHFPESRLG